LIEYEATLSQERSNLLVLESVCMKNPKLPLVMGNWFFIFQSALMA